MIDAMDKAAGLTPDDPVLEARRFRPEFMHGAELCRVSVLTPDHGLGLYRVLRLALARRIASLNDDQSLLAGYDAQLAELGDPGGVPGLRTPIIFSRAELDLSRCSPRLRARTAEILDEIGHAISS